ncbi:pyrroline-5-carboxylate reductase family protein [Sporolactobacillus inulinus]|uniref:Pyrroline-5-carboxylate reductase n=1 Tax=Sporolactobacillus inulinus CASD TaxID=1069536 RepID=A0A0U1QLC5_9BACL|nr:pyrroline-5-carboxylate reductase dimerization domain-containing protein [Sporolactobacillus inulinus]KLI01607.1 pyrroline-5-carboxylate reductase [Sporolactobacillus inulinus CASD]GEB77065.1 pyrroline-5-carboxylate reductase [Sporolactobacillus inulinus]
MTKSLYAIGGGQMVEAIIRASLKNQAISADTTQVVDISPNRVRYLEEIYHVTADTEFRPEALETADVVLLGVRPQDDWAGIAKQIGASGLKKPLISIIAGVTIEQLEDALETPDYPLVRIIPNTLTDTGFGVTGAALNAAAKQADVDEFLKSFGKVDYIPEEQIDIYTGYAIAGPNYVYNFYLALTNAGVLGGLSRKQANQIARENLQGAAKMLEITGKHPYELLDINNSAGGVGITAQHELDASDFAAGVQNAVLAAIRRTTELGKGE